MIQLDQLVENEAAIAGADDPTDHADVDPFAGNERHEVLAGRRDVE